MVKKLQFGQHEILVHRRKNRRNLSVKIVPFKPIQILTNVSTDEKYILQFLQEKKDWIEKTIAKIQNDFHPRIELKIKKGMAYPIRGVWKTLLPVITLNKKVFFSETEKEILIHIPRDQWSAAIHDMEFVDQEKVFIQFFKLQAKRELSGRAMDLQQKMGLSAKKISFRLTKSRWGSCNSRGQISLNWKLICMAPELQDYVIVHELCHLVHLNHSQNFWALVRSEIPNYKELQKKLNELQFIPDFLRNEDDLAEANFAPDNASPMSPTSR